MGRSDKMQKVSDFLQMNETMSWLGYAEKPKILFVTNLTLHLISQCLLKPPSNW